MNIPIEILLVEDTPSDIRLTLEALKRSNLKYKITVVHDGEEAMDYLHRLKQSPDIALPDFVLLDLNMPKKNGHEVLAEIKDDAELTKIPVILLTVSERDEDIMEALRLKMNYYLAKPVTSDRLSVLLGSIHELKSEPAGEPRLATPEEVQIKIVLAGNPHTAATILNQLASDPDKRVRGRVAENARLPGALLEKLASDPMSDVRQAVCENVNAPQVILEQLARDSCEDVRLGLADNPRVPVHILNLLVDDENTFVSSAASSTLAKMVCP